MNLKKFKAHYQELLLSHATTQDVAYGFALGVFISMTPTLGLHTLSAVALTAIFRKNKIAGIIGAWVNNPLTLFPIYYYAYLLGEWILGDPRPKNLRPESLKDVFHLSKELMIPLWIGGIILGLMSAAVAYYLVLWFYPRLKSQIKKRE